MIAGRDGSYPFALFAVVLWLPITIWLGVVAHRARERWVAPAGFAISILVLLYIGRTFNNYYLLVADDGGGHRGAGVGGGAARRVETR
ncbi:MAG: hypothetical protein WKF40_05340 [Thermoleophilaceae bacterium]